MYLEPLPAMCNWAVRRVQSPPPLQSQEPPAITTPHRESPASIDRVRAHSLIQLCITFIPRPSPGDRKVHLWAFNHKLLPRGRAFKAGSRPRRAPFLPKLPSTSGVLSSSNPESPRKPGRPHTDITCRCTPVYPGVPSNPTLSNLSASYQTPASKMRLVFQ